MSDYLKNLSTGTTITEDIIKSSRSPSVTQIVNQALNGVVYIQNIGVVQAKIQVDFVIHKDYDSVLEDAYLKGHLIQVSDDVFVYSGYITQIMPNPNYAEGYHACSVILQEEVQ